VASTPEMTQLHSQFRPAACLRGPQEHSIQAKCKIPFYKDIMEVVQMHVEALALLYVAAEVHIIRCASKKV